jgi:outer membrane receptor protein involved in Fe transport
VTNSGTFVLWPALNINNPFSYGRGLGLFRPAPELATMLFKNLNKRKGLIEELRFATSADARPLSLVAGVYYSNINSSSYTTHGAAGENTYADCERYSRLMFGTSCAGAFEPDPFPNGSLQERDQHLRDIEIAAYGDLTWHVTDRFRLIGGVRMSRVSFDYWQANAGVTPGHVEATVANGGIIAGSTTESPISPKFGAQYQVTDDSMVYVTAAKGFRPGGVNPPITQTVCGTGLALVGLTSDDIPAGYDSDTVWSYEIGAKTRLANRFQVNASAYRIDWTQMQFTVSIPSCGPTFLQNIGASRIQGFDLQAQGRLFGGFTANVALGYTHAEYIEAAFGPKPLTGIAVPVVQKGDKLPVPPWQASVGLQYDFGLAGKNAYVRGDYQYASGYWRGLGPGVNSFNPETRRAASTTQVNMRAGVNMGSWDFNLFVDNLFEARDVLSRGGGISGCALATQPACPAPSSFNPLRNETYQQPRTIGVQIAYRR